MEVESWGLNVRCWGMHLYLIRHGETEWALSGRHTSRTDLPLTEHGRAQAATLKARLAGIKFAQVLSSPRQRARTTAELAGFPQAEVCEDLREFEYGDYEGLLKPEILVRAPGWNIFRDGCPGGEEVAQVVARAQKVISRVREGTGDTLVFSHGHMGRMLAVCWLGQPPTFGQQLILDTCTVNILSWEKEVAAVQAWNCAGEGRR